MLSLIWRNCSTFVKLRRNECGRRTLLRWQLWWPVTSLLRWNLWIGPAWHAADAESSVVSWNPSIDHFLQSSSSRPSGPVDLCSCGPVWTSVVLRSCGPVVLCSCGPGVLDPLVATAASHSHSSHPASRNSCVKVYSRVTQLKWWLWNQDDKARTIVRFDNGQKALLKTKDA